MSRKQNLYTGRTAQLAVMAEFLRRGYNAAIPEIDVGEDVFVVRDEDGDLTRVQVKGAVGRGRHLLSGTFNVPLSQLRRIHEPELFYVFTMHNGDAWKEFVIIRRDLLEELHDVRGVGNEAGGKLLLRFSFQGDDVVCSQQSLQAYRNNWTAWPLIRH